MVGRAGVWGLLLRTQQRGTEGRDAGVWVSGCGAEGQGGAGGSARLLPPCMDGGWRVCTWDVAAWGWGSVGVTDSTQQPLSKHQPGAAPHVQRAVVPSPPPPSGPALDWSKQPSLPLLGPLQVPVSLMDGIIGILDLLAKVFPQMKVGGEVPQRAGGTEHSAARGGGPSQGHGCCLCNPCLW